MKTPENILDSFESLLCLGKSVLNLTPDNVQKLFFRKEMCLYEYIHKDKAGKGIEIALDTTVLVCVFENELCNKSILYFNDLSKIASCIRYCDSTFDYDKESGLWIGADSCFSLEYPDDNDKRFAFAQQLIQDSKIPLVNANFFFFKIQNP